MWIALKDKTWVTNATFDKNVLNVKTQLNNADSGYPEDSELDYGKICIHKFKYIAGREL